jgi:mgtE-like transporter
MAASSVKRIVLESYPVLAVCILIALAAGHMLNTSIGEIREVPMILMMIPPINGIGGNIGSILGARLASALNLGTIEPKLRGQKVLRGNVVASCLTGLGAFSLISAIFFVITRSASLTLAFLIAGIVLTIIITLVTIASAFISFRGGLDPDNIVIPIVTSIGDVLGVTCLIMAIQIMGV